MKLKLILGKMGQAGFEPTTHTASSSAWDLHSLRKGLTGSFSLEETLLS